MEATGQTLFLTQLHQSVVLVVAVVKVRQIQDCLAVRVAVLVLEVALLEEPQLKVIQEGPQDLDLMVALLPTITTAAVVVALAVRVAMALEPEMAVQVVLEERIA
jgi:hypothetical protein